MDKKTKFFGITAIVCICLAITMLSNIPAYLQFKNNEITDLNNESLVLNKGDLIEGDVDMVLGAAVEEYSTNFGVRTSKDSSKLYYVIWLDNNRFALYETGNKEQYEKLEKLTDETFDYFDSKDVYEESGDIDDLKLPESTMHLTGRVTSMPSDVKAYYVEWYNDAVGDSDFSSRTETLMITNADFSRFGMIVIVGAVSAALAVLSLILTLVFYKKSKADSNFGY